MAAPERVSLATLARYDDMQDYSNNRSNSISKGGQRNSSPYYEGVFANERSKNSSGDVTPVLLRPPITKGFLNLPRYVPKYTINSRQQQDFNRASLVGSGNIQTQKRPRGKNEKNIERNDVPYFKDEQVYSNHDQTYVNHAQPYDKKSNAKVARKNRPGKCKDCCRCSCVACCHGPKCGCTSSSCCSGKCGCTECTPLTRRVVCVIVVVVIIAAALAAIALALYFGYFEQLGDSNEMAVDFIIKGIVYPDFLADLRNSQTVNVTAALCNAFEATLEDINDLTTKMAGCSAVSYTNGSIRSVFNLDVRHNRDAFLKSGSDAFIAVISDRLNDDFRIRSTEGHFYSAIRGSFRVQNDFTVELDDVTWGYKTIPKPAATMTKATTATTVVKATVVKTTVANATIFLPTVSSISNVSDYNSTSALTVAMTTPASIVALDSNVTRSSVVMTTGTAKLWSNGTVTSIVGSTSTIAPMSPISSTINIISTTTRTNSTMTSA